MAVVRADLFDPIIGRPAAWAVLNVRCKGRGAARSIADGRGVVAVGVPYPPPVDVLPESPAQPGASLWQQEWTLTVRVGYAPAARAPMELDLCAALQQPLATAWQDAARTTPLTAATLRYGHELILRSFETGRPLPVLLVTPSASP
jgi:hypothetical protein